MGGNGMNLPLMWEWNVPSDGSSLTSAQMYLQTKAVRAQWELLCRLFHLDVEILPNSLFLFIYGMPDQRQRVFRISISRREAACHPPQTSSAPQEWRVHPGCRSVWIFLFSVSKATFESHGYHQKPSLEFRCSQWMIIKEKQSFATIGHFGFF